MLRDGLGVSSDANTTNDAFYGRKKTSRDLGQLLKSCEVPAQQNRGAYDDVLPLDYEWRETRSYPETP
jgi:hypothetical protein